MGEFIPPKDGDAKNISTIVLNKEYINFGPYRINKPRDTLSFSAIYPEMLPFISSNNTEEQFLNSIPITVKMKNVCIPPACGKKSLNTFIHQSKPYDIANGSVPGTSLSLFLSSSKSGAYRGRELYVEVGNVDGSFFICKPASSKYTWCNYHGELNNLMFYSFKFEKSNLKNWKDIKIKVLDFLDSVIVKYEHIQQSI